MTDWTEKHSDIASTDWTEKHTDIEQTDFTEKYAVTGDNEGWLEGQGWFVSNWFGDGDTTRTIWTERVVA